jgi:DNA uptake protein ComE-like DNA-binding protein
MSDYKHDHPGQKEPRAHGETHHEDRIVDLNTAPEQELADLPMVGPDRAHTLCERRPFSSWEEVEALPGFGKGMLDDLKSGGGQIGS